MIKFKEIDRLFAKINRLGTGTQLVELSYFLEETAKNQYDLKLIYENPLVVYTWTDDKIHFTKPLSEKRKLKILEKACETMLLEAMLSCRKVSLGEIMYFWGKHTDTIIEWGGIKKE